MSYAYFLFTTHMLTKLAPFLPLSSLSLPTTSFLSFQSLDSTTDTLHSTDTLLSPIDDDDMALLLPSYLPDSTSSRRTYPRVGAPTWPCFLPTRLYLPIDLAMIPTSRNLSYRHHHHRPTTTTGRTTSSSSRRLSCSGGRRSYVARMTD